MSWTEPIPSTEHGCNDKYVVKQTNGDHLFYFVLPVLMGNTEHIQRVLDEVRRTIYRWWTEIPCFDVMDAMCLYEHVTNFYRTELLFVQYFNQEDDADWWKKG